MTKIFLPIIKETVINISSVLGSSVDSESAMYCASKWVVPGFTKAVALDVPEIKFYIVNPGSTSTRKNDYQGVKPEKVAEVIFEAAQSLNLPTGSEVGVNHS
jgi:short-subunit dehydrogenase